MATKPLRSKANPAVVGPTDLGMEAAPQKMQVKLAGDRATVVAIKAGNVTIIDKLKKYYKAIIALVGGIVLLLNQITPMTAMLGASTQHAISVALVFLTSLLVFLKSNEHWVDG